MTPAERVRAWQQAQECHEYVTQALQDGKPLDKILAVLNVPLLRGLTTFHRLGCPRNRKTLLQALACVYHDRVLCPVRIEEVEDGSEV